MFWGEESALWSVLMIVFLLWVVFEIKDLKKKNNYLIAFEMGLTFSNIRWKIASEITASALPIPTETPTQYRS